MKCVNTKTGGAEEDRSLCDHEPWPENTQKCNTQDCDPSEAGGWCGTPAASQARTPVLLDPVGFLGGGGVHACLRSPAAARWPGRCTFAQGKSGGCWGCRRKALS